MPDAFAGPQIRVAFAERGRANRFAGPRIQFAAPVADGFAGPAIRFVTDLDPARPQTLSPRRGLSLPLTLRLRWPLPGQE